MSIAVLPMENPKRKDTKNTWYRSINFPLFNFSHRGNTLPEMDYVFFLVRLSFVALVHPKIRDVQFINGRTYI